MTTNSPYLLALDQGTTSTRAVVYDLDGKVISSAQRQLPQVFPRPGWVEHDPEEIWSAALDVCRNAIGDRQVAAMGITNQRETVVLWDRITGKPLHNAIVWQDRRTAERCVEVASEHETLIQSRTGLVVDPYFSASKIAWLLEHVDGLADLAQRGNVLAGTIDSFLLWRLTGGTVHATDATNASRTMLYNIHTGEWDSDLLQIWGIPQAVLPNVLDSNAGFGITDEGVLGQRISITGIAGDQHAATIGQACFEPGMAKCTYGTGAFLVLNTGPRPVASKNRMLTTLAWQIDGKPTYALEGSIFSAGSAVQWLRDRLGVIPDSRTSQEHAEELADNGGVYLVPAFTGLGAPHWDPDARGAIFGLTRDTGPAHLSRATLESVAYQTLDLTIAMEADGASGPLDLRVDGGMAINDWLCQFISDMTRCPVRRPVNVETTAFGVAMLAGLGAGLFQSLADIAARWIEDRSFEPSMDLAERDQLHAGWQDAVRRVLST